MSPWERSKTKWREYVAVAVCAMCIGYLARIAWGDSRLMFSLAANLLPVTLLWLLFWRRVKVLLAVYEMAYRRGRRDSESLLVEIGMEADRLARDGDDDE